MIQSCAGWILDVYIQNDEVILWIKTENGKALRLIDDYEPEFYIQPKNELAGLQLLQILSNIELVKEPKWDSKFVDIESIVRKKLIYIRCHSTSGYHLLLKVLQHDIFQQRINHLFNTHLSHLQRYLFTKLKIQTTSRVEFEYEDRKLVSIKRLNDNDFNSPFSIMHVKVCPTIEQTILDRDDPIQSITIKWKTEEVNFRDDESKMLQDFFNYVISGDPDIIIFKNYDLTVLVYLLDRIRILSLDLQLGRWKTDIYSVDRQHVLQKWAHGRVYLNHNDYITKGLDGLFELAQFSFLPLNLILKYSFGRLIANRNIYELLKKDYVISDNYQRNYEHARTLEEIVDRDKAGMIFSPRVGLHENVAVLDYNDEFANIIVNEGISYEENRDSIGPGILPQIVKELVERRVHLRQLLKQLSRDSIEEEHCKRRADMLKKILVCLYGTTGSYWNKYGNVLAFEEINKKSREILIKTKDIVQELGYELVYADTDAAFVHRASAQGEDYKKLGEIISNETGLSLSLEYHYKFLVLLPLEADEKLEALKHYFGITHDGELIMRGIETRRHDSPEFIKQFQTELLYTLFDCDKSEDISSKTLENALFCVTKTIDKIMTGDINTNDLVVSKQLGMEITNYKNIFPHVAAAIQLSNTNGKPPVKGDVIQYVYTDSHNQNPLNRIATGSSTIAVNYDKEKYKEMLLDAAETVLGVFGFDRTLYGKAKDKKWWMELKRNRIEDIHTEVKMESS